MKRLILCGLMAASLLAVQSASNAGSACCPSAKGGDKEARVEQKADQEISSECDAGAKKTHKDRAAKKGCEDKKSKDAQAE